MVDEHNSNYSSIDGILYTKDGKKLIECPANLKDKDGKEVTSIEIPETVEAIWQEAFKGCVHLENTTIYGRNTTVGTQAFDSNMNLFVRLNSHALAYAKNNGNYYEIIDVAQIGEDGYLTISDAAQIAKEDTETTITVLKKITGKGSSTYEEVSREITEELNINSHYF